MAKTINQKLRDAGLKTTKWAKGGPGDIELYSNIEALKDANEEKDKMIDSLLGDMMDIKDELRRYKEILHQFMMKYQEIRDAEEEEGIR